MTGAAAYPLHRKLTNSTVLERLYAKQGSYLCPQAYPEGCPTHPDYRAPPPPSAGRGRGCSTRCSTPSS